MMDTINATNIPTARICNSTAEKAKPNLTIFNKLAPTITGMAR